jgi:hypothetical protein
MMTNSRSQSDKGSINLLAHILAEQAQTSFDETLAYIQDNPNHITEFEKDMREAGIDIVHSNVDVSVFDITSSQNRAMRIRTLHFNTELDLVQSAVPLNTDTGDVDYDIPLPFDSSNYIVGMSYSFLFHFLNSIDTRQSTYDSNIHHHVKRCAVLGAGGCVLPVLISRLFPFATVDAVEISRPVIDAAKSYFGIDQYIAGGRVNLHESCALKWMRSSTTDAPDSSNDSHGPFDMIFVDICEMQSLEPVEGPGGAGGGADVERKIRGVTVEDIMTKEEAGDAAEAMDLVAPSQEVLHEDTCRMLVKSLSEHGVLAINVLSNNQGLDYAISRIASALEGSWSNAEMNMPCSYHIGVMRLPVSLTASSSLFGDVFPGFSALSEDVGKNEDVTDDGEDTVEENKRINSIVFVTKNPSHDVIRVVSAEDGLAYRMSLAVQEYVTRHREVNKSSITALPFDRSGALKDQLIVWMDSYKGFLVKSTP